MKILITGADGFIGRALVARLLSATVLPALGNDERELILLDRGFRAPGQDSRVRSLSGDIADSAFLREAVAGGVDCVFHLASVPGGAAESDFALGMRVNLQATSSLLELLRSQQTPAKFVFASTIGVYGVPLPAVIDEDSIPGPTLSYGAQKWIGEILVSDYSRRGFIDGRSIRLPGIVARSSAAGMLSAFLSEVIRALSADKSFTCPVSADGMSWWMSRSCVVDNLLHAAALGENSVRRQRAWLLPVLHASIADVVAAIARLHGPEVLERISYQPNPALQAQFANYPPLRCPNSVAAGFKHDGSLEALVTRALDGP
jgi:nucleoside-diphosphate-sugar epimerase